MLGWPCEFCDQRTAHVPATVLFTDSLGFAYRLCGLHHTTLVEALRRIAERRLVVRVVAVPRRAYRPRPTRAARLAAPTLPTASGQGRAVNGEDQRRARERLRWSLRRASAELDRSRGQLTAAEIGVRPVDPEVAAWVVSVLTQAGEGGTLPTKEQEAGVDRR